VKGNFFIPHSPALVRLSKYTLVPLHPLSGTFLLKVREYRNNHGTNTRFYCCCCFTCLSIVVPFGDKCISEVKIQENTERERERKKNSSRIMAWWSRQQRHWGGVLSGAYSYYVGGAGGAGAEDSMKVLPEGRRTYLNLDNAGIRSKMTGNKGRVD